MISLVPRSLCGSITAPAAPDMSGLQAHGLISERLKGFLGSNNLVSKLLSVDVI